MKTTARRLRVSVWALVAATCLLPACAPPPEPPPAATRPAARPKQPDPVPRAGERYRVDRIVDGDTLVLDVDGGVTKIRLKGVDTPESVDPRRPVEAFGKEASAYVKQMLTGRQVRLEFEGTKAEQDRYGRTLAYVYRQPDDLEVNAEIIRRGYGHAYVKFPFKKLDAYRALERGAREQRVGLWADADASKQVTDKEAGEARNRRKK